MSEVTLSKYVYILSKVPDIPIDKNTDIDATIIFIRAWLGDNVGEGKLFKAVYPQLIMAIKSYLKMYESQEDLYVSRIAKSIRQSVTIPIYKSAQFTQVLFLEKFLSKVTIRGMITNMSNELPYSIPKEKMHLLYQLLYDTGCRIEELSNIKVKDVDFISRQIILIGKGKYIRKVQYQISTEALLKAQCVGLQQEDTIFGWKVETCKRYFKLVTKFTYSNAKKETRTQMFKVSPHWFRHSRATHLGIIWKKDVIRLRDYMGWSSIKMADTYISNITLLPTEVLAYKSEDLWED